MRKKPVLIIAGVVVAVVAGGVLFVMTRIDRLVADAVETYGGATIGTNVRVRSADVALTQSRGTLHGLTVANPDGYDTDYFLRVEDVGLALDLASLRGAVPVVREVVVDGAHLNAEQRGDATNLTDIQRRMREAAAAAPASHEDEGRVIIDRFRLTHGRITLTSEALRQPEELALADVTVEGIGRSAGGATYDQATEAVLTPILRAARTAVEARLRSAAADTVKDEVKDAASERLRKLLDSN